MFPCDIGQFYLIQNHSHSQIFDYLGVSDLTDLNNALICANLRLMMAELQVAIEYHFASSLTIIYTLLLTMKFTSTSAGNASKSLLFLTSSLRVSSSR